MVKKLKQVDKIYWIGVGAVVAISLLVLILGGVFPFGNNSFGCYDYYYQVIDITSNIFNVFSGRSDLFFSFDFNNGSSFFGNIFYSAISPFSLLMIIGGRAGVRYLFPLVMTIKFITIAIISIYFIRKYFKHLNRVATLLFALMYLFGGYLFMAITQPDWIDFLIYFPLAFIAFDVMRKTGKIRYLALVLSLIIVTSFSLGVFTILYMLVIFFFYLKLVVEKGERAKICTKTLLAVLVAVCSTLFITIPCFIEVLHSTRTGSLIESISNMNIFRNTFEKFGYLLPSASLIIPSIMLVIKNWKKKVGKFYFVCILLILIPAIFDNVNVAMNFSLYAGYSNRLGALYNFIFFVLALIFVESREKEKLLKNNQNSNNLVENLAYVENLKNENENKVQKNEQSLENLDKNNEIPQKTTVESGKVELKSEKALNPGIIATFSLLIFATILIAYAIYVVAGRALATQSFGLKMWGVISIFYVIILVFFGLIWLLKRLRFTKKSLKTMSVILCFILIVCQSVIFLSGNTMEIGTENDYYKFSSIINSEETYANVAMKLQSGQLNRGWSSMSGFSSLTDENTVKTYTLLGYSDGGHNIGSNANNIFADMISGMKYRISDYEINAPYLTEVAREGEAIMYEYNMYLSHAYFVDNLPEFDQEKSKDFIYNQNQIYKAISGDSEDLITEVGKLNFSIDGKETDYGLQYLEDCIASFDYVSTKNELVYVYAKINSGEMMYNENVLYSGSNFLTQTDGQSEYSFEFDVTKNTIIYDTRVYTIDYEKLTNFYSSMQENTVDVTYTKDTISASTEVLGKYLIINHPSIYGYEYYLNGERLEVDSFAGFIAFNVENLENVNVLVEFTYPSVKISLICLAVGVVLLIAIILFAIFFDKLNHKFLKFINITFYILIVLLMIYYFVLPFIFALF